MRYEPDPRPPLPETQRWPVPPPPPVTTRPYVPAPPPDDDDQDWAPPPPHHARPRRRGCGCGGCGCGCLPLLLLAVGVAAVGFYLAAQRPFGDRQAATLLVLGADQPGNGRPRSDTLLVARVNLSPALSARVLSVPRDTRVKLPGHSGWHKINAAYGVGGPKLVRQTLEANWGLKADYTLVLHCDGLVKLVDAVGGVYVEVPEAMDYEDHAQHLSIHLKRGYQHLTGRQAEGFVRFRHDKLGDLGRVQRQQQFIRALAGQALAPQRWWRLPLALGAASTMVESDLGGPALVGLGLRFARQRQAISGAMLPGRPQYSGGVSWYVPTGSPRGWLEGAR